MPVYHLSAVCEYDRRGALYRPIKPVMQRVFADKIVFMHCPGLDYTPPSSFSTWQFSSEAFNVVTIALLDASILANIGSLASKLIHHTPSQVFSYDGWLRAIIFAASDDPLRLLYWLRRRYHYREPSWSRSKSRLRLARLLIPLSVRIVLLLVSFALIILSMPVATEISDCPAGDYAPVWNYSAVASKFLGVAPVMNSYPIQMKSAVGEISSEAEYSYYVTKKQGFLPPQMGTTSVKTDKDPSLGVVRTHFQNFSDAWSVAFWLSWRRFGGGVDNYTIKSDVGELDVLEQLNITLSAIQSVRPECEAGRIHHPFDHDVSAAATSISCELSVAALHLDTISLEPYLTRVIEHYISGVQWKWYGTTQKRIFSDDSFEIVRNPEARMPARDFCPALVKVKLPVLNILPLTMILAVSITVNIIVSCATCRRGNALDSGYHIVKESLGHDTTTNPLEENLERQEISEIEIGRWWCTTGGGGHVGFIGRQGDVPVDEFDGYTVVAHCGQADMELTASQKLRLEAKK